MLKWPSLTTLKELRAFLGLTGYYRRFVANYGSIAWPLTEQLKKGNFKWGEAAEAAFKLLKSAITTVPVLALPNFSQPFVVETDASGHGLGAVLSQNQRPIAFFSHALPPNARLKSVYERELMAIVFAVQKWRHYLLGCKIIVRTDQKSLKFLLEQRLVSVDHQKWLTKLMGFDFDIQYRPGLENKAVDALSRLPLGVSLMALIVPHSLLLDEVAAHVTNDPWLRSIITDLQSKTVAHDGYSLVGGQLLYKNRLVLPRSSLLTQLVFKECHEGVLDGHSGVLKTFK